MKTTIKAAFAVTRKVRRGLRTARTRRPAVWLAFSSFHYSPRTGTRGEYFWSGTGQVCAHLYATIRGLGVDVTYRDRIRRHVNLQSFDLVFSCMMHDSRHVETRRRISYPAICNPAHMNARIATAAAHFGEPYPEYLFGSEDLYRFREELLASDRVIVLGNEHTGRTYYGEFGEAKVVLANLGIDHEHFWFRERSLTTPVFLHSPTVMSIRKGTYHVLKAWRNVRAALRGAELWIMGADGREVSWKRLLEQPGVRLFGTYQGDPGYVEALNRTHFVVLPSLSEGQPASVLEAMSCGNVPILTPSCGIRAAAYGGFCVEEDSVEALEEQMIDAGRSEANWLERSRQARATVVHDHTWLQFNSLVEATVGELLPEPERR